LKAIVRNPSNDPVTDYTVNWTVIGPGGGEIFDDEVVGQAVNPDQERAVTASETFTATTPGEYNVTCLVNATDDANALNDTTFLRFFVGGAPRWFRYDDNGDPEGTVFFGAGSGKGVSFEPINFPASIESLRVAVGGAVTGDLRLYLNDAQGSPTGQPLWSALPNLATGWNSVAIDPPLPVYEGQSFTVAYFFGAANVGLGTDATPPAAAAITNMGAVGWESDGSTWTQDMTGNWSMQVYLDTNLVSPPYPVIDVDPDTLQFGQVDTTGNTSVVITLWVYNGGAEQNLNVTNMVINPAGIRPHYSLSRTTMTVAPGDSEFVDVTFNPNAVNTFNGVLVITNNSNNAPTKNVVIRGQGVAGQAAGDPLEMPTQFELSQNFPNPFNPSTEISFALPQVSDVRLSVYNMLGQQVDVLAAGTFNAGYHTVTFDATQLPAGLYFYRIEAGDFTAIRKMMLLK
jgi:hypothetical protein